MPDIHTSKTAYPGAFPHDPIAEIGEDLFMVRGSIRMNRLMTISRNMTIIRHGSSLMLVNPIRLNETGEEELDRLGTVRWILRLGAFHGQDDRYYKDRYEARFLCQSGGKTYCEPEIDVVLDGSSELPIPDATLHPFENTKHPEAVVLLSRGDGVLLTCDSVQHYGDYRHNNLPARLLMPYIGFPKTTIIGPMWLKFMTPDDETLKSDFDRLLGHDFDALLSAHGSFLEKGAKDNLRRAISQAFD